MNKLMLWAMPGLIAASGLLLIAPARAGDDKFPDGPGKDTFLKVCTQCHEAEPIADLRHSKDEWKDLVFDMKGKGADATDEECNVIVEYLFKNFGKKEESK